MKMFIFKISVFLLLLLICDYSLGGIFKLYDYSKGGTISKVHTLMNSETPEVLILGSSRASHHYVPTIIRDSLKMSVYNGGMDGQGTPLAYGIFKGVSQRKTPKVLIIELSPTYDLYEGFETDLNVFYPYLEVVGIRKLITSFDSTEAIKTKSNAYKLNSKLVSLIPNIFIGREYVGGYSPLFGKMSINNNKSSNIKKDYKIDAVKEKWFRTLIKEAQSKDCKLIFTISPVFGGRNTEYYSDEINIINEYNQLILNYVNDNRFINNIDLYQDKTHMNDTGARVLTNVLVHDIDSVLHISDVPLK